MLMISPIDDITKNVSDDNLIQSYLMAIDNKNKKEIEDLYQLNNKNNIEKDIVYEIYNKNELNSKRLQFIIENCISYLNISSFLIKNLMKDNNKELLEILFKNLIILLLSSYLIITKAKHQYQILNYTLKLIMINIKY